MSKKGQIIQTAIKLFVTQGFENTPTKQISKEAKVATGTLFHHFKTKEELINEAYIHIKEKWINYNSAIDYAHLGVEDRFRKLWFSSIEWGFHNQMEVKFTFMFSNSIYITKLTKDQAEITMEPFKTILIQGIKEDIFKDIPPKVLGQICFCIYNSFLNPMFDLNMLDNNLTSKSYEVICDALKKIE